MSESKNSNKRKGIKVGIGFDLEKNTYIHLDMMALMLDKEGKLISNEHFIFYNNLKSPDGSVEHLGSIVLEKADYEQIIVDTDKISSLVKKIIFFVNINDADKNNLQFGSVKNLYIRFTKLETKQDIAEYKPETDNTYKSSNLIVLAEMSLINNEWQILALGDNFKINLSEFIDIISKQYSYDKFKEEYSKNKNNDTNYSVKKVLEKDIESQKYKVLECTINSTDDQIKKNYKELIKSFHPDIIQSKNLHKDIVDFANKRFKEIKEAYDYIREKRNF